MIIPARKVGSTVNDIDREAVKRIGLAIGCVIEGTLGGECAITPVQIGRLSFRECAEVEWMRRIA